MFIIGGNRRSQTIGYLAAVWYGFALPDYTLAMTQTELLAARLRSEIAQLEARYDGGALPPSIYKLLVRLKREVAKMEQE